MDAVQKFDAVVVLIALAVLALTVYVSQMFITTVLFSLIIIFILKPFHNVLYKFTKNSNIASMNIAIDCLPCNLHHSSSYR